MARERMVSRTIKTYTYVVDGINPNTREISRQEMCVTGEKLSEAELKAAFESDNFVPFRTDFKGYTEALYVMKETDFIKYGTLSTDGKRALTESDNFNDCEVDADV